MKNLTKKGVFFCGCLFSILVFTNTVIACSCFGPQSVQVAFDESDNVAILKIASIEELKDSENYNYEKVNLVVRKVFKGDIKVGENYSFSQKGKISTSCDRDIHKSEVGEDYLFYAGDVKSDKGSFKPWTCSRSRAVKYHAKDLLYLEKLKTVQGKTRLAGIVYQSILSANEEKPREYNFLQNKKIRILSKSIDKTLKTDKNGVYEIYDLPPGKYKISVEEVSGYFYNEDNEPIEIEIQAKAHTEEDIQFTIDNSINGKLFDANGKDLEDVCLDLVPTNGKNIRYFYGDTDCTDEDGQFEFSEIPIGSYIIVINKDGKITSDEPFGTFYFPNVKDKNDAAILNIDAGIFLEDLVINAPETLETVTLSGTLLYEDDKPVDEESINFFENIESVNDLKKYQQGDSRVTTDSKGNFSIKILKNKKGILLGSMMTYSGEYKNCPKLEKLIKESGEQIPYIRTSAINIEASEDQQGIVLKLPFPSCKKAERD